MSLSRRLANLGKAIDSATTGHFLSKGDSDGLFETIQYTDLTGRPTVLDSANVTAIVDSAYVQLRQTVAGSGGLDSAAVTTLVDSAYVSARSPAASSGFAAYEYNTSAAQTTFQDSDANGNILSYSENGIIVYYNGVLMPTSDYTATDGSSVVFTTAVDSGGTVTIAKWALASSGGSGGAAVWYGDRGFAIGSSNNYIIDYFDITTPGNSSDFGDMSVNRYSSAAVSDTTYGVIMGGYGGGFSNVIDYVTIATPGNATDFGDTTIGRYGGSGSGASDGTYGLTGGGYATGSVATNVIDYITIASPGNATDFGDLTTARYETIGGANDATYGLFAGGYNSSNVLTNTIDYVTIATPSNATDFGDLLENNRYLQGTGNGTYGIFSGGINPSNVRLDVIQYVTIATTSNATDFGDMTEGRFSHAMTSNADYGVMAGGQNSSNTLVNTMDYFATATPGNASDFGDLTAASRELTGTSGSPS